MAIFMVAIVLAYLGIVMLGMRVYIYFKGVVPGANKTLLRVVFYGVSVLSVVGLYSLKRRLFSKERLRMHLTSIHELTRYLTAKTTLLFAFAQVPAISGFILFAVGKLFIDFLILASLTVVLVVINIPNLKSWERKIKEASEGS